MSMNKTYLKVCILFILISFTKVSLYAKIDRLKEQRVHMINLCHIGAGVDFDMKDKGSWGPVFTFRFGHDHELFNYALNLSYSSNYKFNNGPNPMIYSNWFSFGVSLRENLWNYHGLTLSLSEGILYNMPFSAEYEIGGDLYRDLSLVKNHLSASVKLSVVIRRMEFGLFYSGSISPMHDQKYIYESYTYDYNACRDQINSRSTIGLSIMYHIDL